MLGQRFGKLTVIGSTFNEAKGYTLWECRCDCGNEVKLLKFTQVKDRVLSCGCRDFVCNWKPKPTMNNGRSKGLWRKRQDRLKAKAGTQ